MLKLLRARPFDHGIDNARSRSPLFGSHEKDPVLHERVFGNLLGYSSVLNDAFCGFFEVMVIRHEPWDILGATILAIGLQ